MAYAVTIITAACSLFWWDIILRTTTVTGFSTSADGELGTIGRDNSRRGVVDTVTWRPQKVCTHHEADTWNMYRKTCQLAYSDVEMLLNTVESVTARREVRDTERKWGRGGEKRNTRALQDSVRTYPMPTLLLLEASREFNCFILASYNCKIILKSITANIVPSMLHSLTCVPRNSASAALHFLLFGGTPWSAGKPHQLDSHIIILAIN